MASTNQSKGSLKAGLGRFARIPDLLGNLETSGSLKTLYTTFHEIFTHQLTLDPVLAMGDKDALKIICNEIIDEVWNSRAPETPAKSRPKTLPEALPGQIPDQTISPRSDQGYKSTKVSEDLSLRASNLTHRRSEGHVSIPSTVRQTHTVRGQSFSQVDGKLLSEFNVIKGPATFSRQKRRMGEVSEVAPGPGSYNTDPEILKTHSPKAMIPVSGKRIEFAFGSSPGPAYYTPLRHFIAK